MLRRLAHEGDGASAAALGRRLAAETALDG
jgi:hypothetical protein